VIGGSVLVAVASALVALASTASGARVGPPAYFAELPTACQAKFAELVLVRSDPSKEKIEAWQKGMRPR
jgi:hypothetical protein